MCVFINREKQTDLDLFSFSSLLNFTQPLRHTLLSLFQRLEKNLIPKMGAINGDDFSGSLLFSYLYHRTCSFGTGKKPSPISLYLTPRKT